MSEGYSGQDAYNDMFIIEKEIPMKSITVYDVEAKIIEDIADKNDMTTAEVVEMLAEYAKEMVEDNNLR